MTESQTTNHDARDDIQSLSFWTLIASFQFFGPGLILLAWLSGVQAAGLSLLISANLLLLAGLVFVMLGGKRRFKALAIILAGAGFFVSAYPVIFP